VANEHLSKAAIMALSHFNHAGPDLADVKQTTTARRRFCFAVDQIKKRTALIRVLYHVFHATSGSPVAGRERLFSGGNYVLRARRTDSRVVDAFACRAAAAAAAARCLRSATRSLF